MTIDARAPSTSSKSAAVTKLLSRTKGATSAEMITATGWQSHSVRAFLSGLSKKGQALAREARKSGEAAYRLVDSARVEPLAANAAAAVVSVPTACGEPAADAATTAPAA